MIHSKRITGLSSLLMLFLMICTNGCMAIEKLHYMAPLCEQGESLEQGDIYSQWSGHPMLISIRQAGIELKLEKLLISDLQILMGPAFLPLIPIVIVDYFYPRPPLELPLRVKLSINPCGNSVRVDCNNIQFTTSSLEDSIAPCGVEIRARKKTFTSMPGEPGRTGETINPPEGIVSLPSEQYVSDRNGVYILNLLFQIKWWDLDSFELQISGITVGETEIAPITVNFMKSEATVMKWVVFS